MQQRDAIGKREAGAEISPLPMVPLSEKRNMLRMIGEKVDFHVTRSVA